MDPLTELVANTLRDLDPQMPGVEYRAERVARVIRNNYLLFNSVSDDWDVIGKVGPPLRVDECGQPSDG